MINSYRPTWRSFLGQCCFAARFFGLMPSEWQGVWTVTKILTGRKRHI